MAHSAQHGFALAGSGAIREHGLIGRPTQDIDLFGVLYEITPEQFAAVVDRIDQALTSDGWQVTRDPDRSHPTFQRLIVEHDGFGCEIDMGVDYRNHPAVTLELGPLLAVDDAVANKITAMVSRQYPRDDLDVDAIRQSGRWTDERLLELARHFDRDCTLHAVIGALRAAVHVLANPEVVADYKVHPDDLPQIVTRLTAWGEDLEQQIVRC